MLLRLSLLFDISISALRVTMVTMYVVKHSVIQMRVVYHKEPATSVSVILVSKEQDADVEILTSVDRA